MMGQSQDWDGIVQERIRSWEIEVRQRQLLAQIPRQRARWRRWAGSGLMRAGRWLTLWGERMAESDCEQSVSVAG